MSNNIVIGLPSPNFLNLKELDLLCEKYMNEIKYWYISPPFGVAFASRRNMLYDFSLTNISLLQDQLDVIKNRGQKIELAINSRNLLNKNFNEIKIAFDVFCKLYGPPDSIVTLKEFIPYFSQFNIPITYSYNNIDLDKTTLPYCETIVLGNRYMRDINLMKKLKSEYNLNIELLVNNGCHFLCNRDCGKECLPLQKKNLELKGKYQCLAEQSFLPCELKLLEGYIDYVKISSRPASYEEIYNGIKFYSKKSSIEEISQVLPMEQIKAWSQFSRMRYLNDQFLNEKIDYEKIYDLKNDLWKDILGQSIDLRKI